MKYVFLFAGLLALFGIAGCQQPQQPNITVNPPPQQPGAIIVAPPARNPAVIVTPARPGISINIGPNCGPHCGPSCPHCRGHHHHR